MEETAESLLHELQRALLRGTSGDVSSRTREALRDAERLYGAQAIRSGRRLHEMVRESDAWSLFERRRAGGRQLRIHGLTQCEPVLQVMRDCGELDERERLLRERDQATLALWRRSDVSDPDRWLAADALELAYLSAVRELTAAYRPFYRALRRKAGSALPLGGPRVHSRPILLPPVMALLFAACHATGGSGETEEGHIYRRGSNTVFANPPGSARNDAELLDATTWDIATLAVIAFFARTAGDDPDAAFPFLLDDYADWRRLDPRKRTPELRRKIEERLDFLCSDRLRVESAVPLWRADTADGRRRKTTLVAAGPFLIKRGRFFQRPRAAGERGQDAADGCLLSLGPWARALVEHRSMRGVCPRRLAEYDLQRRQWERRIGWYLTIQMHNQASKMTVDERARDGKPRVAITPQHPLRMRTILAHSGVVWQEMARTNPGKVIRQWLDALDLLHRDGIIGAWHCVDGAPDGSDLPVRGRLTAMLERRYQIVPGRDLLPHVLGKHRLPAGNRRPAHAGK